MGIYLVLFLFIKTVSFMYCQLASVYIISRDIIVGSLMGVTHFTLFSASSAGFGDASSVKASVFPVKACERGSPPSHELLTADSRALFHFILYNGGRQDGTEASELQL